MAKLTPMMQQYMDLKEQYKDCLLFFRLGDFYELFFEDALTASRALEITLTGRDCGQAERAPMCGVPHHSVENYIHKLITKGYKVAICEQVEDPKEAKGIVKREVIRIVTPGTNLNTDTLTENKNNYLMSLHQKDQHFGIAVVDVTTGEFVLTEVKGKKEVYNEIAKYEPSELIHCDEDNKIKGFIEEVGRTFDFYGNPFGKWNFEFQGAYQFLCDHFGLHNLDGLGLKGFSIGINAAGALLRYVYETQKGQLSNITKLMPYQTAEYMHMDISTRRNLELVETLRDKDKKGSLLWVLDQTKTAMGGRLLRKWIEQPLIQVDEIIRRRDGVESFYQDPILREEAKEYLHTIYDIERLVSKVVYKTCNARDLVALKNSLQYLPHVKQLLSQCKDPFIKEIDQSFDELQDIYQWIADGICDEPPVSIKEGGIIRDGFNAQVDRYRKASKEGKQWIAEIEGKEKQKTGIKNLKIKYNKVFGYYIEVTKSYLHLVPEEYQRKQTLANAERYITPELKKIEDTILGAEEKVVELEYQLFVTLRDEIGGEVARLQQTAYHISIIDVLQSLAEVAEKQNYIKPVVLQNGIIEIKDGRHPVVEKMMKDHEFISNHTYLDMENHRFDIITGPNMAGKSTYMRQVALIVLLAQIGSYVPASQANIGIVDRIFTRVGASDDLASGQSTFMVEMTEVANILHHATEKSLLILDEIGRGTSTFDGLSIAWAVVEYIANPANIGAKTLFATHYHELTELEGKIEGVQNYCVGIEDKGEDIVFLHKIQKGGADQSYGIEVAKLAGLPSKVLNRAKMIVQDLEKNDLAKVARDQISSAVEEKGDQLNLFSNSLTSEEQKLMQEIRDIDVMRMTPIEAMQVLHSIQQKANGI